LWAGTDLDPAHAIRVMLRRRVRVRCGAAPLASNNLRDLRAAGRKPCFQPSERSCELRHEQSVRRSSTRHGPDCTAPLGACAHLETPARPTVRDRQGVQPAPAAQNDPVLASDVFEAPMVWCGGRAGTWLRGPVDRKTWLANVRGAARLQL
jgi:hypothetical protein